jgi:nicotinamidase/pyrazinamidase
VKREGVTKAALIVVDVQRDFCEGGALAAADTTSLLMPLEKCIEAARKAGAVIVFTGDWHPSNHSSFKPNGGPWPVHCVAGTKGAELMPLLRRTANDLMIHKGVGVNGTGYSGFETGLDEQLKKLGVSRIAVSGIATEYCVRATTLDGLKAGFETFLLTDMVRPVEASATAGVLAELQKAGARELRAEEWLKRFEKWHQ